MANKHKQKKKSHNQPHVTIVPVELRTIRRILDQGDVEGALTRIGNLAKRSPQNIEVHRTLFEIATQANERSSILYAAIRLSELQPVPENISNLFFVQMKSFLPALAIQTGNRLLSNWPSYEKNSQIREIVTKLDVLSREFASQFDIPDDECREVLTLHDNVQLAFDDTRFDEVIDLTSRIISMAPKFVPAYNNRSKANFHKGNLDAAIEDDRRSLSIRPDNVHALNDIVHYMVLLGRLDEARDVARELLKVRVSEPELIAKKAEAFSLLCDDRTILSIMDEASQDHSFSLSDSDPFLFHYAAVAAARTGNEDKARELWKTALAVQPSFQLARLNLEDLDRPPGRRNGAYPFEFRSWFSIGEVNDLLDLLSNHRAAAGPPGEKLKSRLEQFVLNHPWFSNLVPVFLERGDPVAREFAVQLVSITKTPEALAALTDFAGSPNGPDDTRFKALQILSEAGIIEKGKQVVFWSGGTKREITLTSVKIDGKSTGQPPPKGAQTLMGKGIEALRKGDLKEASRLFAQARQFAPNDPSIEYNSILVDVQRGNISTARTRLRSLTERHPEYIFARTQLAMIDLANDRIQEAAKHVGHLASMEHFHFDEYAAYMKAAVFLSVLEGQPREATEKILSMFENVKELKDQATDLRAVLGDSLTDRSRAKSLLSPLKE